MDFGEDVLACGSPDGADWIQVALLQVGFDGGGEFLDTGKAAIPHTIRAQIPEEALHPIPPRRRGRREVQDQALASGLFALTRVAPRAPGFHLRVLVGGVVVEHPMQRPIGGRFLVELFEEGPPLPLPCGTPQSAERVCPSRPLRAANKVRVPWRM